MRKTCSWKENSTNFIHQNLSTRVYRNAKSAEYSFYNALKVQHIALCNNMSDSNWSLLSSQDMWRCPVWSRNPLPVTSSPHRPLGSPARAGMWKGRTSCCLSPVTCCSVCNTSMGHMSWGGETCLTPPHPSFDMHRLRLLNNKVLVLGRTATRCEVNSLSPIWEMKVTRDKISLAAITKHNDT